MAVHRALQTYLPNSSLQTFLVVADSLIFCIWYLSSRTSFPPKAPRVARNNYPIVGALGFFTERWTFCQRAIADSPTGNFSFHVGKHPIIGVSGEEGRKVFFDNRQLGFTEGYV
jgi:sterol 14-demethylase